jgi:tRNA 5-methylaminomethyl-2-thiouridine biosynthesis bifunctional protein
MAEAVQWLANGTARSPRFDDIYATESGGLPQARHVFLEGCRLPQAWAGQPQWRILETGFGLGLNFLATWQAWRADPRRPRLLHFVSVEAWPVSADDLLRNLAAHPQLQPLAHQLRAQWWGLLPGVHRLVFEEGRVLLTLCIGDVRAMLRELHFEADAIFLDGFSPQRNPDMWDLSTLKAVARRARRGTRVATWTVARAVRDALGQCGFQVEKAPGLPPKRDCLRGAFNPPWQPRRAPGVAPGAALVAAREPGRCLVIGAGLAGAAVAASLARRGWQVQVLDAAETPAAGASGLPAGLFAPHVSPDDSVLSRLSRRGIRATLQQAGSLLAEDHDWRATGVLEHRLDGSPGLGAGWPEAGADWSRAATPGQREQAGLDARAAACWHARAGWIRPAALVRAWLAGPGITWQGGRRIARLARQDEDWLALDADGQPCGRADLVVVCTGHATAELVDGLRLQAIRGQVSWGRLPPHETGLPPFPVNGHGHLIPDLPPQAAGPEHRAWLAGATFERDDTDLRPRSQDTQANLERLGQLLPAARLAPRFEPGRVAAWTGVRCASPDRLPAVGPVDDGEPAGLWLCTAMGSRGLSFAALCAELLAARLHGEPLPIERKLAAALAASRLRRS